MVVVLSEVNVEVRRVESRINSVQDRIDFATAIQSNFQYGEKVWLSGLAGKNSTLKVVQGTLGYVHPKGRYINLFINGQSYQQSIMCVGSMFVEEDIGDSKFIGLKNVILDENL